jgi:hypothetical protein
MCAVLLLITALSAAAPAIVETSQASPASSTPQANVGALPGPHISGKQAQAGTRHPARRRSPAR